MSDVRLRGCRILVVEDEYLIATDVCRTLEQAGGDTIGPLPTVGAAVTLIERGEPVDVALLDINLQGEMVYPLADMLRQRGVPFAFATGYDDQAVPERFADAPRILKPLRDTGLVETMASLCRPATGKTSTG